MQVYLLVDFGSTYTKVTAVDLEGEVVLGRAQAPTTIQTDICEGYEQALEELRSTCDLSDDKICKRYASSSAAGGLKMVAIGLVPDLTLKAAQRAALGAGAKVVGAYGYELDKTSISEIEEKRCDIVMLCGGTDGGNKDVIVHNAKMLADSAVSCPILVCGNRCVSDDIRETLTSKDKQVYITKNVLPSVNTVEVEPAQNQIRDIFIAHIIRAKGLDRAQSIFDREIIPTPKASLLASELLADGVEAESGIGSLMVVEVGGATTNIHSVSNIIPFTPQTIIRGLPESRVSRTVEGDLGIRYNARTILQFVGADRLRNLTEMMDPSAESPDPDEYTKMLNEHVEHVPENTGESLMDAALAKSAVDIAVERHAGSLKTEFSVMGEINIQYGKNLLEVRNVLGTGGIFKYGAMPERILSSALFSAQTPWSMKPKEPRAYIDENYLFYATGLLSQEHPAAALRIMKRYLKPIELV